MMTTYNWVRELPADRFSVVSRHEGKPTFTCTQEVLDGIATYQMTIPTGPSAGRIYNRYYPQHEDGACWIVFIVEDAPADDPRGGQLHHPHKVIIRK